MKKMLSLLIAFILLISTVGCVYLETDKTEIVVFAASSLTDSLNDIKFIYEKLNPNIKIIYNFNSSGTLKTQIEEGAPCDIFISANEKFLDELNNVDLERRINLLENKVVLTVTDVASDKIRSFDDMAKALECGELFMAIGNKDVPVGIYTKKIFDYFNVDEKMLNKKEVLTYCSNAKEVTTLISEEIVDCAIVYSTDACVSNLNVVDIASEEMCGKVIYPAAVLSSSKNISESKLFLDFLKSAEAKTIFEEVGFIVLS